MPLSQLTHGWMRPRRTATSSIPNAARGPTTGVARSFSAQTIAVALEFGTGVWGLGGAAVAGRGWRRAPPSRHGVTEAAAAGGLAGMKLRNHEKSSGTRLDGRTGGCPTFTPPRGPPWPDAGGVFELSKRAEL